MTYGTVPAGATENTAAKPLEAGKVYRFSVSIRGGNALQDKVWYSVDGKGAEQSWTKWEDVKFPPAS